MPLLRPIFSLIAVVLLFSLTSYGQVDSVTTAADTSRIEMASGLFISVDYGKLATIASEFESKLEASIGFQLSNRISPILQAGYAVLNPANAFENGIYESSGYYVKLGVNYLMPLDNTNTIYAGLRYGFSSFEDEGSYQIASDIFDTYTVNFGEKDQTATWFELVMGSEKKLRMENLYLGGQLSMRFINTRDKFSPVDSYAIPGYGRTFDESIPAVNLYIKYLF